MKSPFVSIIIPTYNRSAYLSKALNSLAEQSFRNFQIIVVDNCSTDNTRDIVYLFKDNHKNLEISYFYEPIPGLLSGRHRGAFEARGDILVFIDDDVEVTNLWLSSIVESFALQDVGLATGPCIPRFEITPPKWTNLFWQKIDKGRFCTSFSTIYIGNKMCYIDPLYVFGLNYSIRRDIFFELKGFHPDCIPKRLQIYQGDGETGLSLKARQKGIKALYHPYAMLYHNIPPDRVTLEYFKERFFYQGVCNSYTQIRHNNGIENIILPVKQINKNFYLQDTQHAYVDGFFFHFNAVKNSKTLLDWVLKENYLDYTLPEM
ncbi:MAG: glycosyltransferase family 2 protein [Thermodesulfovibrionales bacterium]